MTLYKAALGELNNFGFGICLQVVQSNAMLVFPHSVLNYYK